MASMIYLDNSNLYLSYCNAHEEKPGFRAPTLNYSVLLSLLSLGEPAKKATVYTSIMGGPSHKQWKDARDAGWDVVIHKKDFWGREKQVDVDIATDLLIDGLALKDKKKDQLILVAGDADYLPAVQKLQERGIPVIVAFWKKLANKQLRHEASLFLDMTSQAHELMHYPKRLGPNERVEILRSQRSHTKRFRRNRTYAA